MRLKQGDKVALIRGGKVIAIQCIDMTDRHFAWAGDLKFWKDGSPVKYRDKIRATLATEGHLVEHKRYIERKRAEKARIGQ